MSNLVLQPTNLANWHALVSEAEMKNSLLLGEELESYLVYMLMRFTEHPEISHSVMALDFMHAIHHHGKIKQTELQAVGDKCLLFSGFFPGLALRRRVRPSYFADLGQNAYFILSAILNNREAKLYESLSHSFLLLQKTLASMRNCVVTEVKENSVIYSGQIIWN